MTHPIERPGTSWSKTRRPFPRATARRILTRDGECQLRYNVCTGNADEADHIVGHADALAAGWDPADIDDETNGQAACHPCHALKTQAEQARGRQRANQQRPRIRPQPKHPGFI